MQSINSNRKSPNGKDSSNQYTSANTSRKKQKQVGMYKSARVSREITSRIIQIEQALECLTGKHKSENNNSAHTNRKSTNRQIRIGKIKIRQIHIGRYNSDKYKSENIKSEYTG